MRLLALFRLRIRMSFDELVTFAITALAVALVIGYQVLGRRARSSDSEPPPRS
jgi:hypothetical protein